MPQSDTGYTEGRFQLATYAKFNRPDPKRDWDWLRPHTLNLYEYVGNNPVNLWDPDGFEQSVYLDEEARKNGNLVFVVKVTAKLYNDSNRKIDAEQMNIVAFRIENGFSDIQVTGEAKGTIRFEMDIEIVTDKSSLQKGDDVFLIVPRENIDGANGRANMRECPGSHLT